jgi:3-deoxy-D-manno-octulosonic-acid transferase
LPVEMSLAMSILYQLGLALALALAAPFWALRQRGRYLRAIARRAGFGNPKPAFQHALWLHAVSVGEAGVAATLAKALPADTPLLVTTVTPTGQDRASALLPARATVDYLPFDLGFLVRRFLKRHQPRALVLVEGDYWPVLLAEARRRGIPVAVVNARIGDRSYVRLRRFPFVSRMLFSAVGTFAVQSAQDQERLSHLGVPESRTHLTGNLKFESPEPIADPQLVSTLQTLAGSRPLLIAGSTMSGEEEQVLTAFSTLGGGERALLVLAPRHPERWDAVESLIRSRGFETCRRRSLDGVSPSRAPAVLLLDSMGELAALYRIATAAFVGGTLVPTGGHNPLEPARFGVPLAVGPSMFNFRDIAEQFEAAKAWRRVGSGAELGEVWGQWLAEPPEGREIGERAARLVDASRGALAATLAVVTPLLQSSVGTRPEARGSQ